MQYSFAINSTLTVGISMFIFQTNYFQLSCLANKYSWQHCFSTSQFQRLKWRWLWTILMWCSGWEETSKTEFTTCGHFRSFQPRLYVTSIFPVQTKWILDPISAPRANTSHRFCLRLILKGFLFDLLYLTFNILRRRFCFKL